MKIAKAAKIVLDWIHFQSCVYGNSCLGTSICHNHSCLQVIADYVSMFISSGMIPEPTFLPVFCFPATLPYHQ